MSVVPSKPQVAPINAEDYGSGDLDKTFARSKSLRIETRPTRALEALGINAEDIMQQDEEAGPADPFEVGIVVSRLFLLFFLLFSYSCVRTALLALEALGINAEDIMQQEEDTWPADPF